MRHELGHLLTSSATAPSLHIDQSTRVCTYMVGTKRGNLKSSVFFIWGGLCTCAFVYSYFLVSETKGLTLEQVDKMMEETTPRTSAKWRPHTTFAAEMSHGGKLDKGIVENVEHNASAV